MQFLVFLFPNQFKYKLVKGALFFVFALNQHNKVYNILYNYKLERSAWWKMKIGLRAGHSGNSKGAIGIVDEHEQMKLYYGKIKRQMIRWW